MIFSNAYTRIFERIPGCDPVYMHGVGIFRVIYQRNYARIILISVLGESDQFYDLPNAPVEGVDFLVTMGYIGGNPRNFLEEDVYLRFINCNREYLWLPHPMALSADERAVLRCYAQYKTENWEIVKREAKS